MDRTSQKEAVSAQELRLQKKHWVKKMLALKTEETLFTSSFTPQHEKSAVQSYPFELAQNVSERLRTMSGESKEALFLILLTALKTLLHKHTSSDSLTVAYPVNRIQDTSERSPEPNWIPLIDHSPKGCTFREWLNELKSTYIETVKHSDYSMDRLVDDMKVVHDRDYAFLQHIRFSIQGMYNVTDVESETLGMRLHMYWSQDKLCGVLAGNTRFFNTADLERFAKQYGVIIEQLIENPDRPVEASGVLAGLERDRLLNEYATGPRRTYGSSVMGLFAEQVQQTPEATAIVTSDASIRYAELEEKVNHWATALIKDGTKQGDIVGLYLDRSLETAIAILAVWRAGACILPIDVQTPAERVRFILKDAGVNRLLTQALYVSLSLFQDVERLLSCEDLDAASNDGEILAPITAELPAYIIYTSGTTGNPKGVVVSHGGLVNSIAWRKEEYALGVEDNTIQLFSYSFDGFMTGFLTPLVSGASLFMATEIQVKDPLRLKQLLIVYQITHFICVPSLYRLLLQQIKPEDKLCVHLITLAGESVSPALIQESRERLPDVKIYNEYGPTESSIVALCKRDVEQGEKVTIGRPISNMRAYILDHWNEPVSPGIVGELCLSGPGLARGYLNQPELTDQAFVPNPFIAGERLYRTGDLAKWTEEGEICCLGRKDAQVKLRGYRIELPEIEQCLQSYPGVQAAAVVCEEEEGIPVRLIAYLQTDDIKAVELRDYMARELPFYMLPARYYRLHQLPLSENGKLDKKVISSMDCINLDVEFREPENETEQKLCEIFADVLGLKRVSADENFFTAGGHSLKATMLMSRIQKEFRVEISVDHIFEKQTVKALAEVITLKEISTCPAISPANQGVHYPLSFTQEQMYRMFCNDPHSTAYNMPEALVIEGDFDDQRLRYALEELTKRHEILRTTFYAINGDPVQEVHDENVVSLEYSEQASTDLEETIRQFIRPFDLARLPLFRAGITKMGPRKHLLLIDLHHIVADGASIGIFISELASIYNGDSLPEIKLHYKDFSVWQHKQKEDRAFQAQGQYWTDQFKNGVPVLSLPYDHPRPKLKGLEGSRINFTVDAARTSSLKRLAAANGVTLFMLLLTIYQIMLSKLSGQKELVVGSPVSGRTQADLEHTMGMFVNVVPIRAEVSPQLRFTELLTQVKHTALGAFEHQAIQYQDLARNLGYTPDPSRNPMFDTMFVLQNMAENRFDFRGLHFSHVGFEQTVSKFDLTLAGFEGGDGVLYFDLEYCTRLFQRDSVLRYVDYFMHIMQTVIEHPQILVSQMTLLPQALLHEQWKGLNNKNRYDAPDLTLLEQFALHAKRSPYKEALLFGDSHMTYEQLDTQSELWANWLRSKDVGLEDVIAVRMERSFELVIAFLAVLKAGAVYLPIDPEFPADRTSYMLQDSGAVLMITDQADTQHTAYHMPVYLPHDMQFTDVNTNNALHRPQRNNLAYIIYTSGTTGRPKGVALEHAGLANLSTLFISTLGIQSEDRILQFASCSFDASIWEFTMAFTTGGTLCLVSAETIADPVYFERYVEKANVTVMTLPPPYMARLHPEHLPGLRLMITAGSEPSSAMLSTWSQHMRCVNAYGPTEASVCAAIWEYQQEADMLSVPIGYSIPHSRLCVVDAELNPLPVGVSGELCIAGTGLARSYLNLPEITARQFISSDLPGFERMYRTGDLAKLLPDGRMIYQGRMDNQLKIRGYRVEPSEIEARLLQITGVREAVVLPRMWENENSLVAYYTGDHAPASRELKIELTTVLPHYMLPSFLVKLDGLPVTSNGKVDHGVLQRLELLQEAGELSRMPENELEATIVRVFEQVLNVHGIGTDDLFHELGGDSISAMKASFLLKEQGLALDVRDLLVHQSPVALGKRLLQTTSEDDQQLQSEGLPERISGRAKTFGSQQKQLQQVLGDTEQKQLMAARATIADQQEVYRRQLAAEVELAILPLTASQSTHLGRAENVGVVLHFHADKTYEDIHQAIHGLVQEQEMMRCLYNGTKAKSWSLREHPAGYKVPHVKLESTCSEAVMEQLVSELYYDRFEEDGPDRLLYRMVVIENSRTGAKVFVYSSHHALSDGLSCSLIAEVLTGATSTLHGEKHPVRYRDYLRRIEEGPIGISFMELERRFELGTYRQLLLGMSNKLAEFSAQKSTSITLKWELAEGNPEEGWLKVLGLLAVFGREYLELQHLPVQLVSSGRRYGEHTYYHLVGNFTDYIPLVLDTHSPAEQLLQQIQALNQTTSAHQIRFTDMEDQGRGKGILLNYFGAIQAEPEDNVIPDGGPSFAEAADHYGIYFYVRHVGCNMQVHIALPFETSAAELEKKLTAGMITVQ
ncbi:tyrocidine synthetase-2/tyrocidine synthetase-3 [Paenibacillus polysaccharolyticus]|uniref:Tyrocidine synthetase-2/tyrocidine synthetase-3 n=1 Tax=Paenibacillus polysaccharolyticus TaxID=582692 RepID=A0A1G5ICK8_9BACL|nr:non-ribosomal peptide synthetase [Paenibacillus polysaccharolyticus]SCY73743.1 tyrocidine synthetase-2/tyrocidine synthetase-3 [Paenibacillus polysaccharolyticus]